MLSFKKSLLIFFVAGIIIVSFGIWKTTPPKTPQPGSCKILEEKFCSQVKLVKSGNVNLGFNLVSGTSLYSPIDGQTSSTKLPPGGISQGFFVTVLNPNNRNLGSYNLTGDIELPTSGQNIRAGEVFGKIGNTGAKNFGEYNLLINISKVDPITNRPIPDEEKMKQLFPAAYENNDK